MQYDRVIFADLATRIKQFRRGGYNILFESIAAFRWINGKLYGLAIDGDPECDQEYLYVHLQKRTMKFTQGLENEDSFMIIPNEFVKDHALTRAEIDAFMTPDTEYEQVFRLKYNVDRKRGIFASIIRFMARDSAGKIISLKTRWNKLCGRELFSRYNQPHKE